MKLSCLFGHNYETELCFKQTVQNKSDMIIGYDVYLIKKCNKCSKQTGVYIDYYNKTPNKISVDYVKALSGVWENEINT